MSNEIGQFHIDHGDARLTIDQMDEGCTDITFHSMNDDYCFGVDGEEIDRLIVFLTELRKSQSA